MIFFFSLVIVVVVIIPQSSSYQCHHLLLLHMIVVVVIIIPTSSPASSSPSPYHHPIIIVVVITISFLAGPPQPLLGPRGVRPPQARTLPLSPSLSCQDWRPSQGPRVVPHPIRACSTPARRSRSSAPVWSVHRPHPAANASPPSPASCTAGAATGGGLCTCRIGRLILSVYMYNIYECIYNIKL